MGECLLDRHGFIVFIVTPIRIEFDYGFEIDCFLIWHLVGTKIQATLT